MSQNYTGELYFSLRNMLLPISENLCCLDSDHEAYNWICCPIQVLKELLNEPPWVCIICCILDRKVNRFSQEACRGGENFIFWFGAQFNSTLDFTQSGWPILFSPDLSFPANKLGKLLNTLSLAGERRSVQTSHWPFFNSDAF